MDDEKEAFSSSDYAFMIVLQCNTEEEVARAMERLNLQLVGLCLDGINVTMMKMPDNN